MKGDKRGLEMAITTVILIILSISALTILLVFFNSQTSFLSKWFGDQSSESNVDLFISGCNSLSTTQAYYSYCCDEKNVKFGAGKDSLKVSCGDAEKEEWSSGRIDKLSCEDIYCDIEG